ncbi:FKBP-type peptidyl-prolyl cis-trans isomerase [Marinimicrobium sp. C2-29]|uniref:FKBP-type peptidyl-prolyl cis-trans isomerase n=1 Tax=Marinimicrobium sp. C2-29 TaxID=3139825 RepID=UPI0031389A88
MTEQLPVGPGTTVTLHFALRLEDGEEIDSNFEQSPATFTVGDGNLLPGFEKAMYGLKAGARETLVVGPEEGFGQHNPSNIQEIPRDQFDAGLELEEGLMLSFADAQKSELPGVVREFDDKRVVIDFNHPLAGRDIIFDVAILNVEPAQVH